MISTDCTHEEVGKVLSVLETHGVDSWPSNMHREANHIPKIDKPPNPTWNTMCGRRPPTSWVIRFTLPCDYYLGLQLATRKRGHLPYSVERHRSTA